MPGTGTLTLSGTLSGFPSGQRTISVSLPITSAIDVSYEPVLAIGNNTITVPAGANGVIIDPPSANTIVVTLRGTGTDTGVTLHRTLATAWLFDSSQVTFVLNTPSLLSGPMQLTFF